MSEKSRKALVMAILGFFLINVFYVSIATGVSSNEQLRK